MAGLNDPNGPFAGHTDWRVPNRTELLSLVDIGREGPAIDPAFDTGCTAGCTVTTCSCEEGDEYWSSNTVVDFDTTAWAVSFDEGDAESALKTFGGDNVRAVRGGL